MIESNICPAFYFWSVLRNQIVDEGKFLSIKLFQLLNGKEMMSLELPFYNPSAYIDISIEHP